MNAKIARTKTTAVNVTVMEGTFIPAGDMPRNKPETPAMLKLNATDKTKISTKSSFPSANRKLMRQ